MAYKRVIVDAKTKRKTVVELTDEEAIAQGLMPDENERKRLRDANAEAQAQRLVAGQGPMLEALLDMMQEVADGAPVKLTKEDVKSRVASKIIAAEEK